MRVPFRASQAVAPVEVPVAEKSEPLPADKETGVASPDSPTPQDSPANDIDSIDKDAQHGVQRIEATTKVWPRNALIAAYVVMWIIYFVDAMQQGMSTLLTPYVTSSFALHSLTATTGIMSSLIGGISKLTLAKILDIWGRPQGFLAMLILLTMGLVMMAACNNVETYAAAQVMYWVGYNGLNFSMSIFIADTSSLRSRALMFAYVSSPYIITVWITGPISESVIGGIGWRWAFGIFSIITPLMCLPLWGLFTYYDRKAKKLGLTPPRESGRSTFESLKYYFVQFDVIGLLLISGGLALFLLPFSIYSYQYYGWKDRLTLCMLIFGFVLLIAFAVWEKWIAPVSFIPWELLSDRTMFGSCILAAVLFISFYIWDSYFSSFLQVVPNLDLTQTGYIVNIYSIGSCFFSLVIGVIVRVTGRFKGLALYFGVPVTLLGVGLMLAFRRPDVNVGYIVMCQIFIAVAGGTLVICEEMAAMAIAAHQGVAVVLAVQAMFANVGGAIGSTIAAAIWTSVFPQKLAEYLPASEQANLTSIYGNIAVQKSYAVGTPARDAINDAYGEAQKWMLVASTVLLALTIPSVMVWRDIKIGKENKQVKGTVW